MKGEAPTTIRNRAARDRLRDQGGRVLQVWLDRDAVAALDRAKAALASGGAGVSDSEAVRLCLAAFGTNVKKT